MIKILDEDGHPLVGEQLRTLRAVERQADREGFRRALWRLGMWLGYEVGRLLPHRQDALRTPLGHRTEPVLLDRVVLAPVLRAGLPLWQGMLDAFPDADSLVLGAHRIEGHPDPVTGRMGIHVSYSSMADVSGRTLIYVDPMLATGSTLLELHPRVLAEKGTPARTFVVGVVAYRPTLAILENGLAADVLVASADEALDGRGYIVPGLGDAGDLAFGGA